MIKYLIHCVSLFCILAIGPVYICATEPAKNIKHVNEKAVFSKGERLKFQISWQFVNAGYATVELKNIENIGNKKCFHVISEVSTFEVMDNVFKVRDIYESWFDLSKNISCKFVSKISEGNYKRNETILFDQAKHTYKILETKKSDKIPNSVQDVISALYYLRLQELVIGKPYSFDVHMGDTTWPVLATVLYKERISIPAGEFNCLVLMPRMRKMVDNRYVQGSLQVWLSDDENKMPVKIDCKIPLGSISMELVEFKK
ncbi:MAG: DUF3108 domain-containing protein [Elusimicrobia bacterium]|nr:DUF3108 domain-containing protein [Candidatus Liberimonas magnetica]